AVCPSPQPGDVVGIARIRQAEARHLAGAGGRGDAGARRGRAMKRLSTKSAERLLYLISPLGLLLLWQLLLMAGFGDPRFLLPAPTDIALRFWVLIENGELAWHTGVTWWRVFAGFFAGAVPAVAVGLLMAMFKPVRIFFDPLIAALFPIPKVALMPLLLLVFG